METNQEELTAAADRFLSSGRVSVADHAALAAACDAKIRFESRQSITAARKTARRFVARASSFRGALPLLAYRALARLEHMSGSYTEAKSIYLKARSFAGGDLQSKGLIDRALVDVYMYLGDFGQARRRATAALQTFRRLDAPDDIAKTKVNYANLLHRQDRHRQAEKLYREAAEYFEKVGDSVSAARCNYNRANTLVQLFDMERAEHLYRKAEETYRSNGYEINATNARYGLAWLFMLNGKLHHALSELQKCEESYKRSGEKRAVALCELDRAEVYLRLNLHSDALDASRRAERMFQGLSLRYETAKASFFRAQAALALGSAKEARSALKRADQGFRAENNAGFLAAVNLFESFSTEDPVESKTALARARRRSRTSQLPLWQAICDLHYAANPRTARTALGRLARNGAVQHVPYLFATWQTCLGDHEYRRGRVSKAKKHWRQAADRLDAVRAELPPLELRSAFGKSNLGPHLRLVSSELEQNPAVAAVWSERYKTAGLWSPSSVISSNHEERRQVEANLAALAAEVATLAHSLGGVGHERTMPGVIDSRSMAHLRRRIRNSLASIETHNRSRIDNVPDLLAAFRYTSRSQPIVQFHVPGQNLVAFVHENGSTRLVTYDNGATRLSETTRKWRFLVEQQLLFNADGHGAAPATEQMFLRALGDWLWSPLEISKQARKILILPEGELANLPWQAIRTNGQPVSASSALILAPSLRHFLAARRIRTRSRTVHLFAGADADLPEAQRELNMLAEMAQPNVCTYDPVDRTNWPTTGAARAWHFSGHAHYRADNPFYSYLALRDGPLFAADFRLRDVKVGVVTLAACRSGEQIEVPGEESTGLVRSLLEMGARNVIAGHWPVSDKSTALWMQTYYREYFAGKPITDAVRHAITTVREQYPSAFHWAPFSVFGAGD